MTQVMRRIIACSDPESTTMRCLERDSFAPKARPARMRWDDDASCARASHPGWSVRCEP